MNEHKPLLTAAEAAAILQPLPEHDRLLDIREPAKWQMKVRLYLESLDAAQADQWLEQFRMIAQIAAVMVRDAIYQRITRYCYICHKPLPLGRAAGEAGYWDADRINYVRIYCCNQAEFGELLLKAQAKAEAIKTAELQAEQAARQALIDARRSNQAKVRNLAGE